MALTQIQESDLAGKGVLGQPDVPGLSAAEMQAKMEQLVREVVIPKFNTNAGNTYDKTETDTQINNKMQEIGAGDMAKSIYDPANGAKQVAFYLDTLDRVSYQGTAAGAVKAADKLQTARKLGNANFDGSADVTLAQMGVDLADTSYAFTPAANVAGLDPPVIKKNEIKGLRYQIGLQISKSLAVGPNLIGTISAAINTIRNVTLPCQIQQQGTAERMGMVVFGTDKSVQLLSDTSFAFTEGATYPIIVYACNG